MVELVPHRVSHEFYLNTAMSSNLPYLLHCDTEFLQLDFCQLNGTIPSELGNLEKLELLSMAGNRISGTIPTTFGNLRNAGKLSGTEVIEVLSFFQFLMPVLFAPVRYW